jgi:UPF0176 protein
MQKIILFYKFIPLSDPAAVMLWQKSLCEQLGLTGRIIISKDGINGTLGGELRALKEYAKKTRLFAAFKGMVFKWSDGAAEDFPKLSVKVRDEIVTFDAPSELKVDDRGVVGGGKYLSPAAVHELMQERGDEVVFFDGRNQHEAAIGRFKNAIVPDVDATRDFIAELEDPKYDAIKDKPIVTYCTGGIRCEVLSSLMKNRGFTEVYQIDGGIVKYGEMFKDEGLWEGALYVFDKRKHLKFSDQARDIGRCMLCQQTTSNYEDCTDLSCHQQLLICNACATNKPSHAQTCMA